MRSLSTSGSASTYPLLSLSPPTLRSPKKLLAPESPSYPATVPVPSTHPPVSGPIVPDLYLYLQTRCRCCQTLASLPSLHILLHHRQWTLDSCILVKFLLFPPFLFSCCPFSASCCSFSACDLDAIFNTRVWAGCWAWVRPSRAQNRWWKWMRIAGFPGERSRKVCHVLSDCSRFGPCSGRRRKDLGNSTHIDGHNVDIFLATRL